MNPANDKGPPRYIAQKAIDVRELAEHFAVDEDRMRAFCIEHEGEISEAAGRSALEVVEELGMLEGLIPATASPGELDELSAWLDERDDDGAACSCEHRHCGCE